MSFPFEISQCFPLHLETNPNSGPQLCKLKVWASLSDIILCHPLSELLHAHNFTVPPAWTSFSLGVHVIQPRCHLLRDFSSPPIQCFPPISFYSALCSSDHLPLSDISHISNWHQLICLLKIHESRHLVYFVFQVYLTEPHTFHLLDMYLSNQ